MSKLTIKIYPDKILRQKAGRVGKIDGPLRQLASDMIETMRHANGVGLAAPQVGETKRIIVIEAVENNPLPLVLVNPNLLKRRGRSSFCEGCLSVPEVTSEVARPEFIAVEALDLKGEVLKIETGGLLARIIQHEMDHLNGILFIDRIGFLKRKKIAKTISSKVCMEL